MKKAAGVVYSEARLKKVKNNTSKYNETYEWQLSWLCFPKGQEYIEDTWFKETDSILKERLFSFVSSINSMRNLWRASSPGRCQQWSYAMGLLWMHMLVLTNFLMVRTGFSSNDDKYLIFWNWKTAFCL